MPLQNSRLQKYLLMQVHRAKALSGLVAKRNRISYGRGLARWPNYRLSLIIMLL